MAAKKKAEAPSLDPRFVKVVAAFRRDPKRAAVARAFDEQLGKTTRSFGSRGLKTEKSKLFAMMSGRGELVLKLPPERVDELVASGAGERYDPGHGRVMKEWIAIASAKASWTTLAKESHDYVAGVH